MSQPRVVVFVDTHHFVRSIIHHHRKKFDISSRIEIALNKIPEVITELCLEEYGVKPTRQMWYDGLPNGVPTERHNELSRIPGVILRSGRTLYVKGNYHQKAVDTLLVRDAVVYSIRDNMDVMILISGDSDLTPGMQEAADHGITVALWGIEDGSGELNLTRFLHNLSDATLAIPVERLSGSISVTEICPLNSEPVEEAQVNDTSADIASPSEIQPSSTIPTPNHPTPGMMPKIVKQVTVIDLQEMSWEIIDQFPFEDYRGPFDIGRGYASRWWNQLDDSERAHAAEEVHIGKIPSRVDAQLLRLGSKSLNDRDLSFEDKATLRDGYISWLEDQRRDSDV